MSRKHTLHLAILTALFMLTSCLEINDIHPEDSTEELCVSPVAATTTKAPIDGSVSLPRYHSDGSTLRKLKVSAYWNADAGRGTSANYFDNVTFTYFSTSGSKAQWKGGTATSPQPRYWPSSGSLDLFAYCANGIGTASADNPVPTYDVGTKVSTGATITVGDNSSTQVDIVFGGATGQTRVSDGNTMTMRHAQALIVFTAKSDVARNTTTNTGVTIRRIILNDAYFGGTLTMDTRGAVGNQCSWSNLTAQKTAAAGGRPLLNASGSSNLAYDVPTTAMDVSAAGNHFGIGGTGIMLPEQGPVGNSKKTILIEYTIHNTKNDAGTAVDNDVLYEYVCEDSWLEGKKIIYQLNFSMNQIVVVPSVVDWEDGGTENVPAFPDLSLRTYSGEDSPTRNTANCYVVREAGTYDIPLVYGNGIKAGATNAPAYTRQVSEYTADFVNHLGNTLTSPYIEENAGCTASEAGLLWQTHAGMVTEVSLADGSPCRKLRVKVEDIPAENGIAVVYVKDASGNIMWSWTLWMTTDNLEPESQTNYQDVTYQMMPEGLCTIWDAGRTRCRNAYYQWGRKDPMPPSAAYNSTSNCTLYTITGSTYSGFGSYGVANNSDAGGTVRSVANAIRMPEKFFLYYNSSSYSWNNLPWMNNFWNAAMTASNSLADDQASAIKTIYDPCPAGWMLPSGRAWTGFTTTGSDVSTFSEMNVVGSFANGWTFKKNASDAAGTYYPASGCREYNYGRLDNVGGRGYWWSYAPYSQANARNLYFYTGNVIPPSYEIRASGFSVRPCVEP